MIKKIDFLFLFSRPFSPNMIYVVAGNFSVDNINYVNSIFVHENYVDRTQQNDIALIKLEKPLDLASSSALQWIELPDNSTKLSNCHFSFNNITVNSFEFELTALWLTISFRFLNFKSNSTYPFKQPQSTSVAENWFCSRNNTTQFAEIASVDICSYYFFSDSFMCQVSSEQLRQSNDRGTPLVCNDKLVGMLSTIIPPRNGTNTTEVCAKNLQTMAYYTPVNNYVNWIHSMIGSHLPTSTDGKPNPIVPASPPFHAPGTPRPPTKGAADIAYGSAAIVIVALLFMRANH